MLGLGPGMGAGQRVPSVAEEGARPELELGLVTCCRAANCCCCAVSLCRFSPFNAWSPKPSFPVITPCTRRLDTDLTPLPSTGYTRQTERVPAWGPIAVPNGLCLVRAILLELAPEWSAVSERRLSGLEGAGIAYMLRNRGPKKKE